MLWKDLYDAVHTSYYSLPRLILGALVMSDLVLFLGLAQSEHERHAAMVIVLCQAADNCRGWYQQHDIFIQLVDAR